MYKIERLQLRNFMTFEELDFTFPEKKAILIQGHNLSDSGQKSNGSGKSALLEAVYRCLTGNSIRKGITDKDLINDDAEETIINLTLFSETLSKRVVIERNISRKSSEKINITINDIGVDIASVNDGNNYILNDILKLSRNDLDTSFLINREKYISFFFIPDSKKKELIGRFSNANLIEGVDIYVDEDLKELQSELRSYEDRLVGITSNINHINRYIDSWSLEGEETARKEKIRIAEENVHQLKSEIKDVELKNKEISLQVKKLEGEIKQWDSRIDAKNKEVDSFKELDLSKDLHSLSEKEKEAENLLNSVDININDITNKIREIGSDIGNLERKIKASVECPKCHHNFVVGDSDTDVNKVLLSIETYNEQIELFSAKREKKKTSYNEIREFLNSIKEQKKKIQNQEISYNRKKIDLLREADSFVNSKLSVSSNIRKLTTEIESNDNLIKLKSSKINSLLSSIESIKLSVIDDPTIKWKQEIKDLQEEEHKISKERDLLIARISEVGEWKINFVKFFAHLTNKSLKLIEQETNSILNLIKSNLSVRIDGVKVLGDGRLKDNITPTVMRNGLVEGSGAYGKLSGGERVRIEVANLLARQSIINKSLDNGGLDLLWIDEAFDSIDSEGLDILMNSLKELNKSIFITTHIQSNFDHQTIKVVKKDKVSTILN